MTEAQWPYRVRMHGGRNTHAARTINGGEADCLVTACDYLLDGKNDHKPADAAVTCPRCTREMNR